MGEKSTVLKKGRNRRVGIILAFTGVFIPIAGLHKFYLGQPGWGMVYLLLSWTPIPHVASAIEGVWYLVQDEEEFKQNVKESGFSIPGVKFPEVPWEKVWPKPTAPESEPISDRVEGMAEALRQLEKLRQEGLISEYEFEQKRRQLLDKIV